MRYSNLVVRREPSPESSRHGETRLCTDLGGRRCCFRATSQTGCLLGCAGSLTYFQKVGLKAMAAAETSKVLVRRGLFLERHALIWTNAQNRLFWPMSTSWCSC